MVDAWASSPWPEDPTAPARSTLSKYARVMLEKVSKQVALLDRSLAERSIDRYAGALKRLLEALTFYWTNHARREADASFRGRWRDVVRDAVVYLAPVAPHLAEECWGMLGERASIFQHARFPASERAS
jgi:leucyl-tRNA synthetase